MNVDLHSHSLASDGLLNPAAVAARAKEGGVDVWALTDHDETSGLAEAREAAEALGMRFIPGVEISTISPTWWVNPMPGCPRSSVGANIVPR